MIQEVHATRRDEPSIFGAGPQAYLPRRGFGASDVFALPMPESSPMLFTILMVKLQKSTSLLESQIVTRHV
jgi:hypothetical protein